MNGRENIIQALFLDGKYPDVRRYFYANHVDDKTAGRLNQVSKQFNLFGNDYEMWKMKLRRLLLEMDFTNYAANLTDLKHTYRFVLGMQELHAFCLEFMINSFFISSRDDQDAATAKLFKAVEAGSWKPRSHGELDQMAAELHADETKFAIIKTVVNGLLKDSLREITTSKREGPFTIPGLSPVDKTKEPDPEAEEMAAMFVSLGYHRPEYVYARSQLNIGNNPEEISRLTAALAFSMVLVLAPGFLLARDHELVLMSFLINFHKDHPNLLDFRVNVGEGTVRIGDELFALALGVEKLSCNKQAISFGSAPAANLLNWLISIDANCTKRNDRNLYAPQGMDDDEIYPHKLYYHPLYLTLEAMKNVADKVEDSDKAVRYMKRLAHVAETLLDHGAKWDDVAKVSRQKNTKTPRTFVEKVLSSVSENDPSVQQSELRKLLQSLLAHEPKLAAANQHQSSLSV